MTRKPAESRRIQVLEHCTFDRDRQDFFATCICNQIGFKKKDVRSCTCAHALYLKLSMKRTLTLASALNYMGGRGSGRKTAKTEEGIEEGMSHVRRSINIFCYHSSYFHLEFIDLSFDRCRCPRSACFAGCLFACSTRYSCVSGGSV